MKTSRSPASSLPCIRWIATLLCGVILFPGCAPAAPERSEKQGLRVVVTHSILGDWVETIGGDHVSVTTLVGPGGDAHTYEPTPRDGVALIRAELVFENGLGFEMWLDDLFAGSRSSAKRVVVTRALRPRTTPHSEGNAEVDPHVWHNPRNAMEMIREVTRALSQADPRNSGEYEQREIHYLQELETLDAWIRQQVALLPLSRRQLFTTHDTFGYFAAEYGFQVHSILGSVSSEVAEPSAGEIAETIQRIRREQIPAVFTENIINPRLTEQVAREGGVSLVRSLYTDALGPPDSAGGSYLKMMRFNVQTMVEALR